MATFLIFILVSFWTNLINGSTLCVDSQPPFTQFPKTTLFSGNTSRQWQDLFGLATEGGSLYVSVMDSESEYVLSKFSSVGEIIWQRHLVSPGQNSHSLKINAAKSQLYVTGNKRIIALNVNTGAFDFVKEISSGS